jgi:hypothetical protein
VASERRRIVEQLIALWNERRFEKGFAMLAPEFEMYPDPKWPEPGPYSGAAARRFLDDWIEPWDEVRLEAHELLERGDAVVVRSTWHTAGHASGANVTLDFTLVFVVGDDGLVHSAHALFDHEQAMVLAEELGGAAGP